MAGATPEQLRPAPSGVSITDPVKLQSKISLPLEQTHRLPKRIMWGVLVVTAAGVALANFCMVWSTWGLTKVKILMAETLYEDLGFGVTILLVAAWCAVVGAAAAAVVVLGAPMCAGGGLPEAKSYLNGSKQNGFFSPRAFFVRILGTILSVSAGYPIGREGPTICVGCNIGHGAVYLLALPHARRWVDIAACSASSLPALIVDEERLAFAKRLGCAVGGAAGIATIFNAPIGGLLYMLEEVTVTSWAPELTLKAFICTVLACLANRAFLNLCGADVRNFLIFADGPNEALWKWQDMPIIIALAAIFGACSAVYSRALVRVFSWRKTRLHGSLLKRFQPWAKIGEAGFYAALCVFVFGLASLVATCHDGRPVLTEGLQFNCPEGHFNPVATMLFNGPEEAIRLLYSRYSADHMCGLDLGVVFLAYLVLNLGMMGLAVPTGAFIPAMFLGATAGRWIGHGIGGLHLGISFAHPGIYALVGSAAMLGGTLHQTLSIVVFLMECVNALDTIAPLMVTIFISHCISKSICEHGLDEQLILEKKVPYLDVDMPQALDNATITAADLCGPLPAGAALPVEASVAAVRQALKQTDLSVFPVVRDGECVGLTTRRRLQAAVDAKCRDHERVQAKMTDRGISTEEGDVELERYIPQLCGHMDSGGCDLEEALLPISRIMDPAPYALLENTPAPRLYPLFTRLGIAAACVMSKGGKLYGVLSRSALIEIANVWSHGAPQGALHGHSGALHTPAAAASCNCGDVEAGCNLSSRSLAFSADASDPPAPSARVLGMGTAEEGSRGSEAPADAAAARRRIAELEARVQQLEAEVAGRSAQDDGTMPHPSSKLSV